MKHFMEQQERIWAELKNKKIYLLLDYDGTLAPIAQNPDLAVLAPKTWAVLKKLSNHPRCMLAIISGRALASIKKMVKIPKIIYSGNHGFEVDYHGVHLKLLQDTNFQILLNKIHTVLGKKMKGIKGILLENKKMTLSVHYRLVSRNQRPVIKTIFREVITPYQVRRQVNVTAGKMVLEIRPPLEWGKGDLVKWLLHEGAQNGNKTVVFYFGDDRTDEEAFKVVKGKGYAIIVGKNKRSAAEYYLKNPDEVGKVLEQIDRTLR